MVGIDGALPDFDVLWNYDDPAATELHFRGLLVQAERSGNTDYYTQLLTQLARAQGLQRHFAAAHATLDQAETLLSATPTVAKLRYLLERGRVFNSAGMPDRARPLFDTAWQLAQTLGDDGYAVDAAHMLGIVAPPAEKLAWEQQALALAERSAQPRARKWRASLYNNMGWSYHELGQHAQALTLFEQALAARLEAGDAQNVHVARWCVARELRALGRYAAALAVQQQLAEALAQRGAHDGYVEEELGETLLALGREPEAQPYFARAYQVLAQDAWLAEHEPERLARLQRLGM